MIYLFDCLLFIFRHNPTPNLDKKQSKHQFWFTQNKKKLLAVDIMILMLFMTLIIITIKMS